MRTWTLFVPAAAAGAGAFVWLRRRYRRDIAAAQARLDAAKRDTIETPLGDVEFAVRGDGAPLLVSHGIFHGFDGGLLSVRDYSEGRRIIAPSRFGYLGSTLPDGAAPAAQADAFASVLDHLAVDRTDVIGISAGATAAIRFALRHPARVKHLVILSGNLPGSPTAVAQPDWARSLYADGPMWTIRTLLPGLMARLSGVPAGFERTAEDDAFVAELVDSLFPIAPRFEGISFDAFVSNPDVNDQPLESLRVPTLLIHAKDDPLTSYEAAQQAAERIPGSLLLTLESGGHLGLGQTDRVRSALDAFLATPVLA